MMKKLRTRFFGIIFLCLFAGTSFAQAPLVFTGYDLNTLTQQFSNPYSFTDYNGKFVFMAFTDTAGYEPWVSDGTAAGTFLLKNITPYGSYTSFGFPVILGTKLYFHNINRNYDDEIWVTDGTSAGTQLITTIIQPGSNYQKYVTKYNGKMYFTGNDYTNSVELWVSDGTAAGTQMLKDINPTINSMNLRPEGSYPTEFTEFNGKLYFGANDSIHGKELWVTDGTATGTVLFKDIEPGVGAGDPTDFYVSGSYMYFKAKTSATGKELWVTDGTTAGTYMVKDIRPGNTDGVSGYGGTYFHYHNWITYNGNVYFTANDSIHGAELWVTDGTTAGTNMVKDINIYGSSLTGSNGAFPGNFILYKGQIYFAANDSAQNRELWKTDGTASGTVLVKDMATATNWGSNPSHSIVYKNHLYFIAQAGTASHYLWRSDGTDTGTRIIAPAWATTTTDQMAPAGGTWERFYIYPKDSALYFQANFTSANKELWSLNDTTGLWLKPCDSPATITVNGVNMLSATVSWDTVAGAAGYEYYVAVHPSTPPATGTSTLSNSAYLTGLSAGTKYDFCVRTKCSTKTSAWKCSTFTTWSTGIPQTTINKQVTVQPNPNTGSFTIAMPYSVTSGEVLITNMYGQVVEKKTVTDANWKIEMRNAAKGIYMIQIKNGEDTYRAKVVVQ